MKNKSISIIIIAGYWKNNNESFLLVQKFSFALASGPKAYKDLELFARPPSRSSSHHRRPWWLTSTIAGL